MEHPLFKPKSFEEGKHTVVGDCNGFTMQQRWDEETPIFAKEILKHLPQYGTTILDYGCGVGRLAKEILKQNKLVTVIGVDDSSRQLELAKEYVSDSRFIAVLPKNLNQKVDLAYCIYVLQHVPAVELRDIIRRIHYWLKPDGKFAYCSSDYRMAVTQDGSFFDDRRLGVDIRKEINQFFSEQEELIPTPVLLEHRIVCEMIQGNLPHPAKVYTPKKIDNFYEYLLPNSTNEVNEVNEVTNCDVKEEKVEIIKKSSNDKRLIFRNRLSPGDILVMTNSIRCLHKAYPGKYMTDVDTPCNQIFDNNPYITKLNGEGQVIDMHYPEINKSGKTGRHFIEGHRKFLEDALGISISRLDMKPDLFLSQDEINWPSPFFLKTGIEKQYWILNAGSKNDFILKQYPIEMFQEAVNILRKEIPEVEIVQIGAKGHNHKVLDGCVNMVGMTENHRELYRLINKSEGVITCVSYPMHIAAALSKPCVVVAGGREGTRWELYPDHRFLYVNGTLPCASYDGCWKSKKEECLNISNDIPKCMELIKPSLIADSVIMYYEGGVLQIKKEICV